MASSSRCLPTLLPGCGGSESAAHLCAGDERITAGFLICQPETAQVRPLGRLSWLYFRLGLWKDWLTTIDRLRANIQHPWWHKKIAYYRAVYYLAPGGDRTEAQRELAKAGPIAKDEADLDLLHLYVDLEFGDQPFAARITILDRILVLGGERQNHLQYRGAKAIQYFLIGDVKTAELQL